MSKINIIGVPLDLGSERIGVDMGPNALRYQKFIEKLHSTGLDITDHGNIVCPTPEQAERGEANIKYLVPSVKVFKQLASKVESFVKKTDDKVLVIGGDHSVAIGSIGGAVSRGKIGLIWIDAHGDLNTDQTTPSGNIHGMPLAAVLGVGHPQLTQISKQSPLVDFSNLVLIGTKDLDPPEKDFIKQYKLKNFSISDILATGLAPIFAAIKQLRSRVDQIWLSFDVDSVDADYAPGVGMPNKGGLTYREIQALIEFIGTNCDILGMDLVEYNPVNDIDHKTAILVTELTAKAFGKEYSWYTSQYLKNHGLK